MKRNSITESPTNLNRKRSYANVNSSLLKSASESKSQIIEENLKKFPSSSISSKLIKTLYESSSGPSEEFKLNMLYYYLYFLFFLLSKLGFSLHSHSLGSMSQTHMKIHVLTCSSLISLLLVSIVSICLSSKVRLRSRTCFLVLTSLLNLYFVLGDERILCKITGINEADAIMPMSIGLISSVMLARMVLFDDYLLIFIIASTNSLVFITCHLSSLHFMNFGAFSEAALIIMFNILQMCESFRADSRIRQIFIRQEQQFSDNNDISFKNKAFKAPGINTEAENVMSKCDLIIKNLKNLGNAVIYKDIKKLIKKSVLDLDKIKRKIAHGGFEATKIEISPEIGDEDKEFIHQNFMESIEGKLSFKPVLSTELPEKLILSLRLFRNVQIESGLTGFGQLWTLDIFDYSSSINCLFPTILNFSIKSWNLQDTLPLSNDQTMSAFASELEKHYKSNPFHNAVHSVEVLHSLFFFILNTDLLNYLLPIDLLSGIISTLSHDVGNEGLTNSHLVHNKHSLATDYNDLSVLQNMHCSLTFQILKQSQFNILSNFPSDQIIYIRKLVIELIISTDLSKHFELCTKFSTRATLTSNLNLNTFEDKLFFLSMALKASDLAFCAKRKEIWDKWSERLSEEFFVQGDLEKRMKVRVSMFCDRDLGRRVPWVYLNSIARPFYEVWTGYLAGEREKNEVLQGLIGNLADEEKKIKEDN